MKKMSHFLYIGFVFLSVWLVALQFDYKDSQKYLAFESKSQLILSHNQAGQLSQSQLNHLISLVPKDTDVVKIVYEEGYTSIFINAKSYDSLRTWLELKGIPVTNYQACQEDSICFISTYETKDQQQMGISQDFLGNHQFRFYRIRDLEGSGRILEGTYLMNADLSELSEMKAAIFDKSYDASIVDIDVMKQITTGSYAFTNILITATLVILVIMVVHNVNMNKRKVAILSLLGNSMHQTAFEIGRKDFLIILVSNFVSCICIVFIARRIDFVFLKSLIQLYVMTLVIYGSLSLLLTPLLSNSNEYIYILKRQSVPEKVISISLLSKCVIGILVFLQTTSAITSLHASLNDYVQGLEFREIFDIVRFYGITNSDALNILSWDTFFDKAQIFYEDISMDPNINVLLADFTSYSCDLNYEKCMEGASDEIRTRDKTLIDNYERIPIGIVNRNYLIHNDLCIYSEDGSPLDLNIKRNDLLLLIPESQKTNSRMIDALRSTEASSLYATQQESDVDLQINLAFYQDRILPTLDDFTSPTLLIESPLMYVSEPETLLPHTKGGPLLLGGESSLKFIASNTNDKIKLYNDLAPYLKKNNLDTYLPLGIFVSYEDLFGSTSHFALMEITKGVGFIVILLCVYILQSVEINVLLFETESQKISVKSHLGFKRRDIYKPTVTITYSSYLCIVAGGIGLSVAKQSDFNLLSLFVSCLILLLIDLLIIKSSIFWMQRPNRILNRMKGTK